mmetsp:Transcript_39867/g.104438  ORF Transcript_39867/g.104438 Transcript_39867/m.104438 type:complete len:112 (-) Transcript_39867:111-446(-)
MTLSAPPFGLLMDDHSLLLASSPSGQHQVGLCEYMTPCVFEDIPCTATTSRHGICRESRRSRVFLQRRRHCQRARAAAAKAQQRPFPTGDEVGFPSPFACGSSIVGGSCCR